MSKEKQIEEMAKVIHDADINCDNYFPISMSECLSKHGRFRLNASIELYNAGYRKQSEGEWIEVDTIDDGWTQYRCNGCGWNTGSYYKEKYDLHRYCPNCGAKMKEK